jgi:PHD/YefM family antitoxin component YafN of YafNO toxin-antitoxin module
VILEIMDMMRNMDIEGDMRSFAINDLNKQVGEVTDAAAKAPVLITRHRKPRFIMMTYEHYERMRQAIDPRRSYGAGETPDAIANLFSGALDRLATGDKP